ncbi:MAG: galactose mutarotase [Lentisphaeria bacterium]|nr:galactose mutarotase [Lentisphaeria bacterium]
MPSTRRHFGETPEGHAVHLHVLTNDSGMEAAVMDYGAILVSLKAPDSEGRVGEVTLGFDRIEGYLGQHPYFGATVGRYANRIGGARFLLDGKEVRLAANNGPNHLHGGVRGFDRVLWEAEDFEEDGSAGVRLRRLSPDGEEGYPGNLDVAVTYALTDLDELRIDFEATSDEPTPVNLTNHTYFNLRGTGDILDHVVQIPASRYTPVDEGLIPTGEIAPVQGTPLDFTAPHAVRERIAAVPGGGYDHNFVLDKKPGCLACAARVEEPEGGRVLEVLTTEPGAQFYTGNFLDGTLVGRDGQRYGRHAGFCVEPQRFPDSPNQPGFPDCVLRPGGVYLHTIVFRFAVL